MRLSLPAGLLAGCTVALLLQPAATAGPADPDGARRRASAGGGSVTSLPLGPGSGLAPRTTGPFELLGVDRPVHGAHTLGFNTDSAGVAAIGTFVSDSPPQPLLDGLAAIAAWKLGLTGRAQLTSSSDASRYPKGTVVAFDAVSGHRDAFNTECPGAALYARLPALRAAAAHLQTL
ncbi:hypothetical protein ACIOJE_36740 [Kitasatospora sp. NPDC087861]|uniref:hypothetical protein n=1 Tax=Kitasatospora sp. NPDC087861 TaxID=3364070 RepID=UPI0037F5CE29